jgi:dihydroneopterin aldolase
MDRIALHGIRALGRHGVNPGERERAQPFDVDLVFELDLRAAEHSDDLHDTVNYARIHRRIVEIVEGQSFGLLERLAGAVVDDLFGDPRIARAEIAIAKPNLLDGATPSVTLVRENPRFRVSFP